MINHRHKIVSRLQAATHTKHAFSSRTRNLEQLFMFSHVLERTRVVLESIMRICQSFISGLEVFFHSVKIREHDTRINKLIVAKRKKGG